MAFYQFKREQKVRASLDDVWNFISSPRNLGKITPGYMGFEISNSISNKQIYEGMVISYKVSPLFNIKMQWVTEITHIKEKEYFVDEQRVGPYVMWHHQHRIKKIGRYVHMSDTVSYVPPLGILGRAANAIIIRKKLNEIFDFREHAFTELISE